MHSGDTSLESMLRQMVISPEAFMSAIRKGDVATVQAFLDQGHSEVDYNRALQVAASKGFREIVELLCAHPLVDPAADNNRAYSVAVSKGYADIAAFLEPQSTSDIYKPNPEFFNSQIFFDAYYSGNMDTANEILKNEKFVKYLLNDKRTKDSSIITYIFHQTYENDQGNIIKILLEKYPDSFDIASTIAICCIRGKKEVLKVFLEDSKIVNKFLDEYMCKAMLFIAAGWEYSDIFGLLVNHPQIRDIISDSLTLVMRELIRKNHTQVLLVNLKFKQFAPLLLFSNPGIRKKGENENKSCNFKLSTNQQ